METVYSVSSLTAVIRDTLAQKLPFVWVRGEITNISRPASGHIYFSLKDSKSQLQCVWFLGRQHGAGQNFNPLTGEVYENPQQSCASLLKNGMDVLCAGGIGCYAARGQYQMLVEYVQPAGEGELAQAFEQLKRKLALAGYFAEERKRKLPANPGRIALITSTHGAAIHDFLEIGQTRGTGCVIRLFPVPVQGTEAAPAIIQAIALANAQDWAEAIVILRGGGSLEDLWAFNDETLATAIFQSRLPILAGIGHEIDFTLADMTADVRAATPSHAAQILWPERSEYWQKLDDLSLALDQLILNKLSQREAALAGFCNALNWLSPANRLERDSGRLASLSGALRREIQHILEKANVKSRELDRAFSQAGRLLLERKAARLDRLATALTGLNPEAPLKRGYALLANASGVISSVRQADPGSEIQARLADGVLLLKTLERKPDCNE